VKKMYCSNCGKENDDSVAFCAHCGKSPNEVVATDKGIERATGFAKKATDFTVNLVQRCFPWVFAAMFWLTVIGGMVGGAKTAQGLYYYRGDDGAMIIGGLIGLVVGFLVAVSVNGVVATLLKMDKNLQYLADKEKTKG